MADESRALLIQPVVPDGARTSLANAGMVASCLNLASADRPLRTPRTATSVPILRAAGFDVMRIWPESSI